MLLADGIFILADPMHCRYRLREIKVTYEDVCGRMRTYADVCGRTRV